MKLHRINSLRIPGRMLEAYNAVDAVVLKELIVKLRYKELLELEEDYRLGAVRLAELKALKRKGLVARVLHRMDIAVKGFSLWRCKRRVRGVDAILLGYEIFDEILPSKDIEAEALKIRAEDKGYYFGRALRV